MSMCKTYKTSLFTIDKLRGCIFFQLVVIVVLNDDVLNAETFNRTIIL